MLPPLAESMAHNHRPPATRMTSYTGLPLMYARGRRAGAIHNRAMDGKATTALPARAPATAGTHAGLVDRLLMRPPSDLALRVRHRHLRAGARRGVQFVERAGADAGLASIRSPCRADRRSAPSNWSSASYSVPLWLRGPTLRACATSPPSTPSCDWWRLFTVRLGSGADHCRR
jgi:hypothetical protein